MHRPVAALIGALATAAASAQPVTPPPAQEGAQVIEVTVSKRRERLQDVPVAATAIDSASLEKLGLEKLADYTTLVPNMALGSAAGSGLSALVLRGMYTGLQQQTTTTATYLGETPFSASGGLSLSALTTPDPDLVDIERIEVLKGPQGTLYGASSLGGLVRIVPQRADLKTLSGRVKFGLSTAADGGTGHGLRASLNLPLATDRFALLVNLFDRKDAGFTKNVVTGHDKLGQTQARGGSLSARFKPSSDLDINLRLLSQKADTQGAMSQDNRVGTGTPTYGERQYGATFDRGVKSRYGLSELAADYSVAAGTITAALSKARIEVAAFEDYTAAYAPLVAALTDARSVFGVPLNSPPFIPYSVRGDVAPRVGKSSFELRFASRRLGRFEVLAGLFATREKNLYPIHDRQFDANGDLYTGQVLAFDASSPTFTRLIDRDTLALSNLHSTYRETAVYGNATYYVRDDLDATLGLRRASNRQHADMVSPPPGVGFINVGTYSLDSQDAATTFQATLRYRPDTDTSAFARVASGYRPGGIQATKTTPPTYAPDKVVNVEVGVKGRRGDLSYDLSAYHIDWDKIQLNSLTNGIPVIRNGGQAKVDGFEAQLSYRASAGMSLGGSVGLNRARITTVDADTAAATGARVGDPLPNSPRVTAALFGDQRLSLGGLPASVGATVKVTGGKHANYSADVLNVPYTVPAFTTLDLRASVDFKDMTLRLGIDNVTDRNGISGYTTLQVLPGTVQNSTVWLIRPRTLSASLSYRF